MMTSKRRSAYSRLTFLCLTAMCAQLGTVACTSGMGGLAENENETEGNTTDANADSTGGDENPDASTDDNSDGKTPNGDEDPGSDSENKDDAESEDDEDDGDESAALTYYRDTKHIIDEKCGNCHRPGDIAPFTLETYDEVYALRQVIRHSVESGSMPPWSPSNDCRSLADNRSLNGFEKKTLLEWLDLGAPKGNPDDEPDHDHDEEDVDYNMTLEMPEPYTPQQEDDYRCFLIEWDEAKAKYMTAFAVEPGRREMLHHLLVYKVAASEAKQFQDLDKNEEGPGYTCFGGPAPTVHPNEVELIGEWVPGQSEGLYPDGVGLKFNPGDLIIFQHHYNTAFSGELADQSRYHFRFEDSVERPGVASLFFNTAWLLPGLMLIPPGDEDVMHEYEVSVKDSLGKISDVIGASPNDPLAIHFVGPHLHQLGSKAQVNIIRDGGEKECLMDIPEWDFDWQGSYTLEEEMIVYPNDKIHIRCHWDNSAENQPPLPSGEKPDPAWVSWGDGTRDEMCLVGIMVSKPK